MAIALRRRRLDGGGGRPEWRWLRRLPARRGIRPGQPGLEGQLRQHPARRRQPARGADRPGRGPRLCLCRLSRPGPPGHPPGEDAQAAYWQHRAEALRQAVETHFWMEDLGFYALALDGKGRPCRVRASNVGHLLFVGLPSPERAQRVADQLLAGAFHTGWGIRTLADTEVCFNPMSYHNGSVWPHDTAICAAGLARYGVRGGVVKLMSDTFEAAVRFGMRLPELFCGFPREQGETPIAYPVACVPQAWAAGSVFMLLQACLGIQIDGWRGEIHVNRPKLPIGIDQLTVRRLTVGEHTVDLFFQRMGGQVIASISDHEEGLVPLIVRS
ncbi:amylo-alpha-1,6-glucosidase [Nitrospirillum sp. BR 11828]|uniref:amylo-alpha-1,6-glucosidase n=1 Tax=Nitrospirillum sp. BR 11828 TaxID=3104325 RepID=UPI003A1033FE